jgi:hypothetical protein
LDNNFSAFLLADQALRAEARSIGIHIRLPWYRALPLSTVEVASLQIDGHKVPKEQIRFELNGRRWALADCADQINEWWYVLDDGILYVDLAGLQPRPAYEVDLTLNLYPPYMPGFAWVTHSAKRLQVRK